MSGLIVRHRLPSGHEGWLVKCDAEIVPKCLGQFFTQNDRQDVCAHCSRELIARIKKLEREKAASAFTLDDHPVTGALDVFNEQERWNMELIGKWT